MKGNLFALFLKEAVSNCGCCSACKRSYDEDPEIFDRCCITCDKSYKCGTKASCGVNACTCKSNTEDMNKNNFTIISPTEEIYQIIQYGYHEEIVSFLDVAKRGEPYSLPTEYVFIFVEKKPIQYHQYHFASGPKWLALEKYTDYLEDVSLIVSRDPYIASSEINEDYAQNDFGFIFNYDSYKHLGLRTILESKLYDWCQQFDAAFPGELHTYYEDDDFVCYYFKQNPRNNFDLSFTVQ